MKKTEFVYFIAYCVTFFFSRMIFSSKWFVDCCIRNTFAVSIILSIALSFLVLCVMFVVKYAVELRKYRNDGE